MALKHDDTIMTQEGLSSSEDELQGDGMDDVIEQDENEELEAEDESMSDSDSEIVKDDTELELEKLVFGDSAGFRSQLRTFNADSSGRSGHALPDQDGDGAEKEETLAAVDDADVSALAPSSLFPTTRITPTPSALTALLPRRCTRPPRCPRNHHDHRPPRQRPHHSHRAGSLARQR